MTNNQFVSIDKNALQTVTGGEPGGDAIHTPDGRYKADYLAKLKELCGQPDIGPFHRGKGTWTDYDPKQPARGGVCSYAPVPGQPGLGDGHWGTPSVP